MRKHGICTFITLLLFIVPILTQAETQENTQEVAQTNNVLYDEPKPQTFAYNVYVPESGIYQGHEQTTDIFGRTTGTYYLLAPDGLWYETSFTDSGSGYEAITKKYPVGSPPDLAKQEKDGRSVNLNAGGKNIEYGQSIFEFPVVDRDSTYENSNQLSSTHFKRMAEESSTYPKNSIFTYDPPQYVPRPPSQAYSEPKQSTVYSVPFSGQIWEEGISSINRPLKNQERTGVKLNEGVLPVTYDRQSDKSSDGSEIVDGQSSISGDILEPQPAVRQERLDDQSRTLEESEDQALESYNENNPLKIENQENPESEIITASPEGLINVNDFLEVSDSAPKYASPSKKPIKNVELNPKLMETPAKVLKIKKKKLTSTDGPTPLLKDVTAPILKDQVISEKRGETASIQREEIKTTSEEKHVSYERKKSSLLPISSFQESVTRNQNFRFSRLPDSDNNKVKRMNYPLKKDEETTIEEEATTRLRKPVLKTEDPIIKPETPLFKRERPGHLLGEHALKPEEPTPTPEEEPTLTPEEPTSGDAAASTEIYVSSGTDQTSKKEPTRSILPDVKNQKKKRQNRISQFLGDSKIRTNRNPSQSSFNFKPFIKLSPRKPSSTNPSPRNILHSQVPKFPSLPELPNLDLDLEKYKKPNEVINKVNFFELDHATGGLSSSGELGANQNSSTNIYPTLSNFSDESDDLQDPQVQKYTTIPGQLLGEHAQKPEKPTPTAREDPIIKPETPLFKRERPGHLLGEHALKPEEPTPTPEEEPTPTPEEPSLGDAAASTEIYVSSGTGKISKKEPSPSILPDVKNQKEEEQNQITQFLSDSKIRTNRNPSQSSSNSKPFIGQSPRKPSPTNPFPRNPLQSQTPKFPSLPEFPDFDLELEKYKKPNEVINKVNFFELDLATGGLNPSEGLGSNQKTSTNNDPSFLSYFSDESDESQELPVQKYTTIPGLPNLNLEKYKKPNEVINKVNFLELDPHTGSLKPFEGPGATPKTQTKINKLPKIVLNHSDDLVSILRRLAKEHPDIVSTSPKFSPVKDNLLHNIKGQTETDVDPDNLLQNIKDQTETDIYPKSADVPEFSDLGPATGHSNSFTQPWPLVNFNRNKGHNGPSLDKLKDTTAPKQTPNLNRQNINFGRGTSLPQHQQQDSRAATRQNSYLRSHKQQDSRATSGQNSNLNGHQHFQKTQSFQRRPESRGNFFTYPGIMTSSPNRERPQYTTPLFRNNPPKKQVKGPTITRAKLDTVKYMSPIPFSEYQRSNRNIFKTRQTPIRKQHPRAFVSDNVFGESMLNPYIADAFEDKIRAINTNRVGQLKESGSSSKNLGSRRKTKILPAIPAFTKEGLPDLKKQLPQVKSITIALPPPEGSAFIEPITSESKTLEEISSLGKNDQIINARMFLAVPPSTDQRKRSAKHLQ